VGGGKVHANGVLSRKIKEFGMEDTSRMRIQCPYCDDHPILKERCLYCKGTGKIEVGRTD